MAGPSLTKMPKRCLMERTNCMRNLKGSVYNETRNFCGEEKKSKNKFGISLTTAVYVLEYVRNQTIHITDWRWSLWEAETSERNWSRKSKDWK